MVVVPAGALTSTITLTATPVTAGLPANARYVANSAYDIGPNGQTFAVACTVRVNFSTLTLPTGIRIPEVRINKVISGAWSRLAGGLNDSTAQTATASTTSLSTFGLVGVPVASVSVTPPTLSRLVGGTGQVTATPRDSANAALPNRAVAWSTNNSSVATVDNTGLVTFHATGTATITATSESQVGTSTATGTQINPTEPVYSASNSDHKLHVLETWANLASISNLYTSLRSDGGPHWGQESGTVNDPSIYMQLVNQGDGFGSAKHVTIDFAVDPPIAPHGTGAHAAGFHWYVGSEQNGRAEQGTASAGSATTLTDATKNWPVNYWVGQDAVLWQNANYSGTTVSRDILSNTATTVTISGNWGSTAPGPAAAGSTYSFGAQSTTRSWIRGFNLGSFLNKPARDALIVEWAARYRGTNWYTGKQVDLGAGSSSGFGRWLFDHFSDPFGIGGGATCPDSLCQLYYSNSGNTPKMAGLPSNSRATAPAVHRSQSSQLNAASGSTFIVYKQNRLYGTGAGQFIWGEYYGGSPKNADFTGTNKSIFEAGWMYYKIRITKEPSGSGYAYGRGRLEMWMGPTPGALYKVMEFLGDVGQFDEGKVWVDPTGTTAMPGSLEVVKFFNPTANTYSGGGIVDLGTVRVWSHTPQ